MSWEERWEDLALSNLRKGWLGRGGHLTADCLYLKEGYRGTQSQTLLRSAQTRGNGHKLQHEKHWLFIKKIFFTARMVKHRSRLTREVVLSPSLEIFINNKTPDPCLKLVLLWVEDWTRWHPDIPSNLNYFVILWLLIIYYHSTYKTPWAIHSLHFYKSILHFKTLHTDKHSVMQNTHLEDNIYLKACHVCVKKCNSIWNTEPVSPSLSPTSCKGDIWNKKHYNLQYERTVALQPFNFC